MSSTTAWLARQRKAELLDIARLIGLNDYDSLLKPDLETRLDVYIRANQSRLSRVPELGEYFSRLRAGSPVKNEKNEIKEIVVLGQKTTIRHMGRRTTTNIARESSVEQPTDNESVAPPSPSTALSPAFLPGPPSPAVIARAVEAQTQQIASRLSTLYTHTGIYERLVAMRSHVSSTEYISSLAFLIEFCGMMSLLLPKKYLALIPATAYTPEIPIRVNDLFEMLHAEFWSTLVVWISGSVLVPGILAWLFNLRFVATEKRGALRRQGPVVDPFVFNIAKGLCVWLLYVRLVSLPGLGEEFEESKGRVLEGVPGGAQGMLVAAGVGMLTSLYEAALRK